VTFTAAGLTRTVTVNQPGAVVVDDHGSTLATATDWPVVNRPQITGLLEVASDWDYFRFTAPASGTWTFESNPSTGDVYGHLYDSAGTQIAYDDDGGPGLRDFRVTTSLTAGSVYYLAVRNYSSGTATTGAYTITAIPPDDHGSTPATATAWDVWAQRQMTGVLEVAGDWDYFWFTAPATGPYTFTSGPSTGDPDGLLYDAAGTLVTQNDDGAGNLDFRLRGTLTGGQRYHVAIRNHSPTGATDVGPYTITVAPASGYLSVSQTTWEAPWTGGTVTVVPTTNVASWWSATSNASWLTLSPTTGASGTTVTLQATANPGISQRKATVTIDAGGASAVVKVTQAVSPDDHGSGAPTATAWPVVNQPQVTGVLEVTGDLDYFQFTAPVSGTWSFESTTSAGDIFGLLLNSGNGLIAWDYNGGAGANDFRITHSLTAGSVYYLQVRNESVETAAGAYTITVTPPDDHGSILTTATEWNVASQLHITGVLEVASDLDFFWFTAPTTGTYTFTSGPSTGDVYGLLHNSAGTQIAYNDDGAGYPNFRLTATLTAGQRYFVAIRNYNQTGATNVGPYTITATRP
jgi:hypothetical protein